MYAIRATVVMLSTLALFAGCGSDSGGGNAESEGGGGGSCTAIFNDPTGVLQHTAWTDSSDAKVVYPVQNRNN